MFRVPFLSEPLFTSTLQYRYKGQRIFFLLRFAVLSHVRKCFRGFFQYHQNMKSVDCTKFFFVFGLIKYVLDYIYKAATKSRDC